MHSKIMFLAAMLLAAATALAEKLSDSVPKGWIEDYALAMKTAAADGKFVFLAFSGSDWCGWCVKLEREVYSQADFVSKAKRKFVLTMIDCPRNLEILSKLAREQNRPLAQAFGIRGFPTGIVCDNDGTEIGRIGGYVQGGPDAYVDRMLAVVKDRKAKPVPETPEAKAMKEAKTERAAKKALTDFETSVRESFKQQVAGLDKKETGARELAELKCQVGETSVKALEAVVSAVTDKKVKAVYEKKLATLRKNAAALREKCEKPQPQ